MTRKAPFRFFCWKVSCGVVQCFNLLLATIALLQTGLIFLNNLQQEIPLPDGLVRLALHLGLGDDYEATWSNSVFDLRGGLFLEDLRISHATTGESILKADSLSIDWAPMHLAFGIFPPFEELQATGIQFYAPARHSPSGLNEPILEIRQAHLHESDGQLFIDDLLATSGGLRLYFSGSGPLHAPSGTSGASGASDRFEKITALLSEILRLPDTLDVDCRIHWSWKDSGQHQFSVFALAESLVLPGATLQYVLADALLEVDGQQLVVSSMDLDARLKSIQSTEKTAFLADLPLDLPVPISIVAHGPPSPVRWGSIPSRLQVRIENPFKERIPVDLILLNIFLLDPEPTYEWSLRGEGFFAQGTAQRHPLSADSSVDHSFPFELDFRAYLLDPSLASFFPELPDHRLLNGANAGFVRLNARTTTSNHLLGSFVTDQLYIGETRFAHVRASMDLSKSDLSLTRIYVQKAGNESAFGSYVHNFPSSRFSLNATGSIFPSSLDVLLGRWWTRIFTDIQASKPLPGDVTVWGLWRDPKSLKSMTAVKGSGASYREIPVPEMEVRVRSNNEWAYMDKLEAHFGEQRISGKIAWKQGLGDTVRRPVRISFKSDAPWGIAKQASGIAALEQMELTGNPRLSAEGVLWRPSREAGQEEDMIPDLKLNLRNPENLCKVSGLSLEGVSFTGQLVGNHLALQSVSGTIAEGVFTGRIDIRNWSNPERLERHLRLQLFDANYAEALVQFSGLMKDPSVVRNSLYKEDDKDSGRLDAAIDLLIKPEMEASIGRGRITLRNGRIGQIHVFGGLSRALNALGLGFSTMDLNSASLEWQLNNRIITIPQCAVTGPVLNLSLAGELDLESQQLDMKADAFFFRGIVSKVLTPVSDNFQFDVTGSLAHPAWQLRLNPFRWFQNRVMGGSESGKGL